MHTDPKPQHVTDAWFEANGIPLEDRKCRCAQCQAEPKELTDFEHQCLMALVIEYGPEHIAELVADMAASLAEDEGAEA